MRIGHITYRYKPIVGGQEVYIDSLHRIFEEAGHSQRIYQRSNGSAGDNIISVPRLSERLPLLLSFNLALLSRLGSLVKEDALIVNYPEAFPPVAWHRNTVVLSHGSTWTRLTSERSKRIRKKLAHFAFKYARRFVANDTFVLREMGIDIGPKERMFQEVAPRKWFIPNCVEVERFQKVETIPELSRLNPILVPRNFTISRGVDLAIRAFASFVERHSQTNLVIVGEAISGVRESAMFESKLKSLVKELGLESKVYFWGRVDWGEMPAVYSSSLLTLIPSWCSEGTSLSALESMACGTATVSTNVEGLLDLPTIHCGAGVGELEEAMEDVFVRREVIGREQQRIIREIYNLENWRKAWLKVIEQ
ncbi:MAG: glycosyltransferase family 4 protein [Actinomycetota bacterium]|nr:glycosyltransferase family 4 protein [Actinomycetota bacterium]